jgi:hypothetical protein
MKRFNTKIAVRAFGVFLALDVVLFTLLFQVPSDWSRLLWWIFNWPGYKLGDLAGRYLVHQGLVFRESSLLIVIGLVCTLIWSVIIGVSVRRKSVA